MFLKYICLFEFKFNTHHIHDLRLYNLKSKPRDVDVRKQLLATIVLLNLFTYTLKALVRNRIIFAFAAYISLHAVNVENDGFIESWINLMESLNAHRETDTKHNCLYVYSQTFNINTRNWNNGMNHNTVEYYFRTLFPHMTSVIAFTSIHRPH